MKELKTERLILRQYRMEDALFLYEQMGKEPEMYRYTGWNPYATVKQAQDNVKEIIESYTEPYHYGWIIECGSKCIGTAGAYDYSSDTIELGCSIVQDQWNHGYGTEAIRAIIVYLKDEEKIKHIRAWCAQKNPGSAAMMKKAGMKRIEVKQKGLAIDDRRMDKWIYEVDHE